MNRYFLNKTSKTCQKKVICKTIENGVTILNLRNDFSMESLHEEFHLRTSSKDIIAPNSKSQVHINGTRYFSYFQRK